MSGSGWLMRFMVAFTRNGWANMKAVRKRRGMAAKKMEAE